MIHSSAIIDSTAKIADGVTIGHGAFIGADVEIAEGTWIGPHAMIQGPTQIGAYNKIFQFTSIGDEPQDLTYAGEKTILKIGDYNIIREYTTISRGTVKGGGITSLGDHNFMMAYTHIGHDCAIKNNVILINHSSLSGHVLVDDYAIIGGYSAVHQFCHIGAYAFIAKATYIAKDVLPYLMVNGYDPVPCGINTVGLKRNGFSSEVIDVLRRAFKIIFRKSLTTQQAAEVIEEMAVTTPELLLMVNAIKQSKRGILR